MQAIIQHSWMRDLAARNALTASIRFEPRYAWYPHYAVVLASVIWLFSRLPVDDAALLALDGSPGFLRFAGVISITGTALAAALGCVGIWRPGRNNVALSVFALILASTNWL
jgi:hypothetical protein